MKHKILAMPVIRSVILVACLVSVVALVALAWSVAQGQEMITTPDGRVHAIFKLPDGRPFTIDEEELNRMFTETGTTAEELQRQFDKKAELQRMIDAGEAMPFDPDTGFGFAQPILHPPQCPEYEEDLQRQMEKQRQQEELQQQIFAEVGISEAEFEQFIINAGGIAESYEKIAEKYEDVLDNVTQVNYVEVGEIAIGKIFQPMINDVRAEAADFFGEDRYNQLTTRLYQVMELGGGIDMLGIPDEDAPEKELFKTFLLPDVIDLTDDQMNNLTQMQKELFAEIIRIEDNSEEENLLRSQLVQDLTMEERAAVHTQWDKVREENKKIRKKLSRELLAKMRTKLDTLLTAEQKAKLAQIKADIPDYLRVALGGMKTGDAEESSVTSGEWRPGPNSWMPGMGAPGINPNREAPCERRENTNGRTFPGGE